MFRVAATLTSSAFLQFPKHAEVPCTKLHYGNQEGDKESFVLTALGSAKTFRANGFRFEVIGPRSTNINKNNNNNNNYKWAADINEHFRIYFIQKLWFKDSYFGAACIEGKSLGSRDSMMFSYKTLLTIGL